MQSGMDKYDMIRKDCFRMPWEKRTEESGTTWYEKVLYDDPDTGLNIRLVKIPAGTDAVCRVNSCGQGLFVLTGTLQTYEGAYGTGNFLWFPKGETAAHGAGPEDDLTAVMICDGPLSSEKCERPAAPEGLICRDAKNLLWIRKEDPVTGHITYSKSLYYNRATGLWIKLSKYPAGTVTPMHTHHCGHGMFLLSGMCHTHQGTYGPGNFLLYPEGNAAEHGAAPDDDLINLFIIDKPFDITFQ